MDKRYVKIVVTGRPIVVDGLTKSFGTHGPIWLDTKNIFTCLASGAAVYDVSVPDKQVQLNFTNYLSPVKNDNPVANPQQDKKPVAPQVGNFHPDNEPVLNKSAVHEDPALPVFVENPVEPVQEQNPEEPEPQDNVNETNTNKQYQQYYHGKKNKKH